MTTQIIRPFTTQDHSFNMKEVPPVTPGMVTTNMPSNGIQPTMVPIIPYNYNKKPETIDNKSVLFPVFNPDDGSVNMVNKDTLQDEYKKLIQENNQLKTNLKQSKQNFQSLQLPELISNVQTVQTFPPTSTQIPNFQEDPRAGQNVNDFVYNSYEDSRAPAYNQWTRIHDDSCNEENRLKIASKPMKYFVNELNSPQTSPFMQYTLIGNGKQYDVRNDFERAIPTRLNPLYDVPVLPYATTPYLGNAAPDRRYIKTESYLRQGDEPRNLKSQLGTSEVDYNRWEPGVYGQTVQNAGQYNAMKIQQAMPRDMSDKNIQQNNEQFYNPLEQNNVLFMNSAVPYFGISSRDLYQNMVNLSGC